MTEDIENMWCDFLCDNELMVGKYTPYFPAETEGSELQTKGIDNFEQFYYEFHKDIEGKWIYEYHPTVGYKIEWTLID